MCNTHIITVFCWYCKSGTQCLIITVVVSAKNAPIMHAIQSQSDIVLLPTDKWKHQILCQQQMRNFYVWPTITSDHVKQLGHNAASRSILEWFHCCNGKNTIKWFRKWHCTINAANHTTTFCRKPVNQQLGWKRVVQTNCVATGVWMIYKRMLFRLYHLQTFNDLQTANMRNKNIRFTRSCDLLQNWVDPWSC